MQMMVGTRPNDGEPWQHALAEASVGFSPHQSIHRSIVGRGSKAGKQQRAEASERTGRIQLHACHPAAMGVTYAQPAAV